MYLIPIIVPIFVRGSESLVATDWKRSLELLRDSLAGRYGDLMVVAPWLPADGPEASQQVLEPVQAGSGIDLRPAFDWRIRARTFWGREFLPYRAFIGDLLGRAQVVHSGLDDLFRPVGEIAFLMGVRRGVPSVFVQDTDIIVQQEDLARDDLRRLMRARAYGALYERVCRRSVATADLALLKGGALTARYAPYAKCAREIQDTSYLSGEIVDAGKVQQRLGTLGSGRPLRLVYCGRLVARKGVAESVRIVELARKRGAQVELEVIGAGPEQENLARQIASAGLEDTVKLAGSVPYGPTLLERLANHDALLFTPTAEDTPRMIFDGYAAGLPLVATGIPYVEERSRGERAAIILPRNDPQAAAMRLLEFDRDRNGLRPLTQAALEAARYHAADVWYRRRAEWTHEAVARKRAGVDSYSVA